MEKVGFIDSQQTDGAVGPVLEIGACELCIWQPDEDDDTSLKAERVQLETLAQMPLIIISLDIEQCRSVARRLGDVLTGRHVLVHTIRGVESGTMNTASKILHQETPTHRIGFVTGPMLLDDIRAERPAAAVCASHFPEVHDLVEEAMMSSRFRVYHSRDLIGAELSAVYSRLLALMSGLADGLEFGGSLQATLFARGLAEMARFVVSQDGYERTAFGLSGAGNLHIDTHQQGSIDFRMGQHLAASPDTAADDLVDHFGRPAHQLLDILSGFAEASDETSLELHLLQATQAILHAQITPAQMIQGLMSLPALYE